LNVATLVNVKEKGLYNGVTRRTMFCIISIVSFYRNRFDNFDQYAF